MKIFPIKVERVRPQEYKFVEWALHNVCNYSCSFCGPQYKDGSMRWKTLDEYKQGVDKIIKAAEGKPVWFQLTGGEPTLFPKFIELVSYIKQQGAMVSIISNGSRTLRWWEELKNSKAVDYLFLSIHTEQKIDVNEIIKIINLFEQETVETICLITHTKDTVDDGIKAYTELVDKTGACVTLKFMHIGDYDITSLYTEKQLSVIKNANWTLGKLRYLKKISNIPSYLKMHHNLLVTYNDNTSKVTEPQSLMKEGSNFFKNWECEVGKDTMRIESDKVYRGVCKEGEVRSLTEDIGFSTTNVICTKSFCFCGTDMVTTKFASKE